MSETIPIRDLRDTSAISKKCNSIDEPIFITKNGYGDMVIMSMKTYEKSIGRIEAYNEICKGEQQLRDGEVINGEEFASQLKDKYEL